SVSISRWERTSASSSSSSRGLRSIARKRSLKIRSQSISPSCTGNKSGNERRHSLPILGFLLQLLTPGFAQRVETSLAIVFRDSPLRCDPTPLFQAKERRVERALVHAQQILRDLLDPPGQAEPVHGPHRVQRRENDQVQRSLQNLRFCPEQNRVSFRSSTGEDHSFSSCRMST